MTATPSPATAPTSPFGANLTVTPKKGFHMGHVPRAWKPGTALLRALLGARRPGMPGSASWSDYVDFIRDQKQTERCVGAAHARTLHIRAQIQKFAAPNPSAVPYPSERGIYSLAREEVREGDEALVDEGSSPSAADEALSKDIGVPLERDFPEDDANINEVVPADVLANALAIKMTGYHLIDSSGSARVDDVCQTLVSYGPFNCAIPVGPEYEGCDSDTPVMPASTVYGGHDIVITEFKIVNGRRLFHNPGSWDPNQFGNDGWAWLDESVLSDPRASDFSVPTLVTDFSLSSAQKIAFAKQLADARAARAAKK
jgi:hypothetical protein